MPAISQTQKMYLAILTIFGWFALIAQFYLHMTGKAVPATELIIRYFSYFTITTNILVAIYSSVLLLKPGSAWGAFFSKQNTQTAITVYIVIVGIIYNLILRYIWNPQGLQRVVDELLHLVIPILFLLYWIMIVPKNLLRWKDAWPWLIYPLGYIVLILIRGAFSGFYPYPFIDVNKLGYTSVLINATGIAFVFIIMSLLFIAIGKGTDKKVKY